MAKTMTKQEAKEALLKHGRNVITPEFAEEITAAFGETLESLSIKPRKTNTFTSLNYYEEDADKPAVAVDDLAATIAEKLTGQTVHSGMIGHGSYADDITQKAVALL